MTVKPFHFKLKKVSADEERLLSAVYSYLPANGLEERLQNGVREAVARHVGEDISFRLEALHHEPYSTFLSKLPHPALIAVIGLAPLSNKALLEIDPPLAALAIERILGGEATKVPETREFSDTEQGVLQYLLLQLLAGIHRTCDRDERVHFRMDRLAFSGQELKEIANGEERVAVLIFRVALGRHLGFVRLALPDPFVEEGFLNSVAPGEDRPAEREWLLKLIRKFSYLRFPLWAEVGRTALSIDDLAGIEEGDLILFDQSSIALSKGRPGGMVTLRIGSGMQSGIDAELSADAKKAHCRIEGIHRGE